MVVWTCVIHARRPLTPLTSELPSARAHLLLTDGSADSVTVPPQVHRDDLALQAERRDSEKLTGLKEDAEAQVKKHVASVLACKDRLRKAEQRLGESIEKSMQDQTLKASLEFQITLERRVIERMASELEQAVSEAAKSRTALAEKEREAEHAAKRHVNRLERRSKELSALWGVHFQNMAFDPQPLRWAAEQDFLAWMEIERALKDLSDAKDPVALSRSKMRVTGEHHSAFVIPDRVPCRIFYVVEKGTIRIKRMCKKKDV